ncbi:MAG: enolase C-terminal domain-like protein [Candidatus Sericytochromatia bacterium]|nr:enolase C-terminal domain-like protein [Candidatus Sericytochromatia bacterium]
MTIRRMVIQPMAIPFVEAFAHSSHVRAHSDAVVVRLEDEDGHVGHGEGLPRPYVTGETVDGMVEQLQAWWPGLAGREVPAVAGLADLDVFDTWLAGAVPEGVIAPNAALAALELALLDLTLRRAGKGVADILPPVRSSVTYSGVVTAGDTDQAVRHARQMKLVGLSAIKVKVGLGDDAGRLRAIRAGMGEAVSLRLDANGAWAPEDVLARLEELAPMGVAAVEQPLARGDLEAWGRLRAASPVPIMVDESLVTMADMEALIASRACDLVNVRVSKCGGLRGAWRQAVRALEAGLGVQVGSQVGETAILSAAGRHLAAALPEVRFVEGSFGTLLLREDLSREAVRFGHRGEASLLRGPGLGVEILPQVRDRFAVRTVVCGSAAAD